MPIFIYIYKHYYFMHKAFFIKAIFCLVDLKRNIVSFSHLVTYITVNNFLHCTLYGKKKMDREIAMLFIINEN